MIFNSYNMTLQGERQSHRVRLKLGCIDVQMGNRGKVQEDL